MSKQLVFKDFKPHFSEEISKSLARYVNEVVLKKSRYLFFKSVMDLQYAYCTHCNQRHRSEVKLKHKQEKLVQCPHCKSMCQVRADRYGRKYMEDRAVLVWYERSKADQKAITARILSVSRNYSESYENVQTLYNCSHMYLFQQGESHYFQLGYNGWELRKSIYSAFDNHFSGWHLGPKFMSLANIKRAVKGTPFQYSTWERYVKYRNHQYVSDMTEFFDLAARYPCIEYLTKLGLKSFVEAKLYREQTYGAIYWAGKTLQKVLRLTKAEINELRNCPLSIKPKHLRYYQVNKKEGTRLTFEQAYIHSEAKDSWCYKEVMKDVTQYASEETALAYVLKQIRNEHYSSPSSVVSDWHDYIGECRQLGMSLREERYLFPNNLRIAHEKTSKRVKLKADKELNKKIAARYRDLEKYCFEVNGLLIRPAASSIELFDEGRALNHCVGGYADRYANGKSDIFVIRKTSEPDKPFFTLEAASGQLRQCRGFKNCEMTPEIKAFVDTFMKEKLSKKTKKNKTKVTTIRREVAV